MRITKLRLIGFKSFVEPTDLLIEPGLTGVVGPNGCGKSNLLEALRWVMGETSYKSMRASAMDDVIFSGTSGRPSRNMAEVTVFMDNSERLAPAEFNDEDHLEVTRRIEREAGSAYRINGREVRARDVKILFEDAATGARSPALVRQGQIGEIVNAKPEQRRRILEDAAGIAGLHSRRHEAELRLRAAENNLVRIGDVIGQLKTQIDGLKRQARQARRYADLSDDIRKAEAIVQYLTWSSAQAQVEHDEAALQVALEALNAATTTETQATKLELELAESVQPLRETEAQRAAALARLKHEQTNLDNDVRRAQQRAEELAARGEQLKGDVARETALVAEAEELREAAGAELDALTAAAGAQDGAADELKSELADTEHRLKAAEERLAELTRAQADARVQRSNAELRIEEHGEGIGRLDARRAQIASDIVTAEAAAPDPEKLEQQRQGVQGAQARIVSIETTLAEAEQRSEARRDALRQAQAARESANVELRRIEAERETLQRLLQSDRMELPPVIDQFIVQPGYEAALAAALGDDLDVPIGGEDVVHWRAADPDGESDASAPADDAGLPAGVRSLTEVVEAPPELRRRLAQIGLVEDHQGHDMQLVLAPGQRLVSREGGLWRWDGLTAPAGVATSAEQRLAGRNRLIELEGAEADARALFARRRDAVEAGESAATEAQRQCEDLRKSRRDEQEACDRLRRELAEVERVARDCIARLATLQEARESCTAELAALGARHQQAEATLAELPAVDYLDRPVSEADQAVQTLRDERAVTGAHIAALEQERQRREAQQRKLRDDLARWSARAAQGGEQISALEARLAETEAEHARVAGIPGQLEERRQKLLGELTEAETARRSAADALAEAENGLKEATATLRMAQAEVSEQREFRARADARLEAARIRRGEVVRTIQESFETNPEGCLAIAEVEDADKLPSAADAESRLLRLRTDRERLGGVNLQAGAELDALSEQHATLDGERADVEEAIAKLRAGIASLNREGRRRLKEAFETVNEHFASLFTTLFDGGEARLELLDDSEDPLAGGLEIIAKPPGKKPTTLSLLSGGEQSLTAMSLIFAVFLTNPSPICVLDEVDAPLDDANVDRFCNLMERMASETDTRFLVITHHPMTMARVDRLFGVTMVERGVSQLVSVDLTAAEELLEAG